LLFLIRYHAVLAVNGIALVPKPRGLLAGRLAQCLLRCGVRPRGRAIPPTKDSAQEHQMNTQVTALSDQTRYAGAFDRALS
jgi:hypothetical protein